MTPNDKTPEYIIAVYNSASENFRHSEGFGDRRVNLYITLATALMGGLIILVTREFIASLQFLIPAVAFGIIVVLSIGWATFERIIGRNKQTDEYVRSMKEVGRYFIRRDPSIWPYLKEFDPYVIKGPRSERLSFWSPATGGYLQTVAMLNSWVAASLPLLVLLALHIASNSPDAARTGISALQYTFLLGSAGLLVAGAWWLQIDWAKSKYEDDEQKQAKKRVEEINRMNEIETTLIIISSNPEQTVQRVANLRSIGGYALHPQLSMNITDIYLDRDNKPLAAGKLGLRIRVANEQTFIALKGPSVVNEHGVSERLEIEAEWSEAALTKIITELRSRGVEAGNLPAGQVFQGNPDEPIVVLSAMGFKEIQKRKNNRTVRNVVSRSGTGAVLAELVIDYLTFYVDGQEVHHKEVEIEAKSAEGAEMLGAITADLKNLFPDDLKAWSHSKLAIGMAIEKLAQSNELRSFLDDQRNLRPEAYIRIDAVLQS